MGISGRDLYQAVCPQPGDDEATSRLAVLYGPLMGTEAVTTFLLLRAESGRGEPTAFSRLCALSGLTVDHLEKALHELENFQLVRTMYKQGELASYRFELAWPLSYQAFLQHEVFGRLYLKAVGPVQFSITDSYRQAATRHDDGFKDVSNHLDAGLLAGWDEDDEKSFRAVSHDYAGQPLTMPLEFDVDAFLAKTTELMFPRALRTKDNLRIISEMATVFGIDAATMSKLVSRSIDIDAGCFDVDGLHRRCLACKSTVAQTAAAGHPYDMAPVQFLCGKQGGLPVSAADKRLLEYLQTELRMDRQVINVMVEYILASNENRLNRSYVEKIATTWARQKVDTLDKALQAARTAPTVKAAHRGKRPDFEGTEYGAASVDFDKLKEQLFKKG